jgi:hypothetical protein
MKKIVLTFTILLSAALLAAQDKTPTKLRIGLYVNAGTSSLVQGMGMNMNMYGNGYGNMNGTNMLYNYSPALGGGVSLGFPLSDRWSINGNFGYMNRGAQYGLTSNYTTNNSRYRLSYIDTWLFGQYNSLPKGSIKFTASLGLTQSIMISAKDETSASTVNMMDNMNRVDIGMVLGPGMEFAMKKKGAIQAKLLYNYGFMNVFSGTYYDSGMQSNNAMFLLQVGYIFN